MLNEFGFTHYVPAGPGARTAGVDPMVHCFELNVCEQCGGQVQEGNSLSVNRRAARSMGLQVWTGKAPAEVWVHSGFDNGEDVPEIVCDECHNHPSMWQHFTPATDADIDAAFPVFANDSLEALAMEGGAT